MMCSPALLCSCVVQVLCNILVANVSLDCFIVFAWNPSQLIQICVFLPAVAALQLHVLNNLHRFVRFTLFSDASGCVHSCSSECHAFVHNSFICSTQSETDSMCVSVQHGHASSNLHFYPWQEIDHDSRFWVVMTKAENMRVVFVLSFLLTRMFWMAVFVVLSCFALCDQVPCVQRSFNYINMRALPFS